MANTPNIDLVKPAGTDHALVSVLNSNSDKIDSFAGTTNAAISNLSTPEAITITAGTNTTIGDNHSYRIGRIVVVNLSLVTSAAIGPTELMASGFPGALGYVVMTGNGNAGGGNYQAILSTNGNLLNNYDGFQANKRYYFNFSYVASS